jgi:hypothetical protein
MYETNSAIKKYLKEKGFHSLYLFPHLRFMKDYIFEDLGFDAMGWKNEDKRVYLFQFKTNEKPTQKILELYRAVAEKYSCVCVWITKQKGEGILYYE